MPLSAMPEHLNSKEEIEANFPDDSQYGDSWFGRLYKRYQKASKTQFAFSYRCTEWWAKWRKYPITLFAIGGSDTWRLEGDAGETFAFDPYDHSAHAYLSRVQYYKRWHFAVQWPLIVTLHWYPKAADVPVYGEPRPKLKGKVWFGYWNHYDADNVYWMVTSFFFGNTWK